MVQSLALNKCRGRYLREETLLEYSLLLSETTDTKMSRTLFEERSNFSFLTFLFLQMDHYIHTKFTT